MIVIGIIAVLAGMILITLVRFIGEIVANSATTNPKNNPHRGVTHFDRDIQLKEQKYREDAQYEAAVQSDNNAIKREGEEHLKTLLTDSSFRGLIKSARLCGLTFEIHDHQDPATFNKNPTLRYFYHNTQTSPEIQRLKSLPIGYSGIAGSLRYKDVYLLTLGLLYVGRATPETDSGDYLRAAYANSRSIFCFSPTIYWSGIPVNVEFFGDFQKTHIVMHGQQWNGYRAECRSIASCVRMMEHTFDTYQKIMRLGDFNKPQPFPVKPHNQL